MKPADLHYEDYAEGAAFPLGPYAVTADEIIAFAREFDPQPQHLSEEGGRESILGGLAASGFHVCGMTQRMMDDALFGRTDIKGGIGADDIRWLKPVRPGDTLRGVATVESARLSGKDKSRGYAVIRIEVWRGEGETKQNVLTLTNTVILGAKGAA